ncbi:unnamed protein product [Rotaria sp. Silwood2]|nr:unnamed protein product [Rotaria sp. Silwood2]CAF2855873.1 unnamed protein product [Rotaria sp. Silwood2]CAF2974900.1 unnamed protein product [Rotaria sp. Silwood2]CAF4257716.1 unnamed protein product [Rotaria sp. Silwood2]CAF4370799.1 unnamed protein product [Rotaria sp. Silwood2]
MLIDEQGTIVSNHEQIIYIPAHDCYTKFNIYLLYSHRPKHSSINYSIRIDLFDKSTLDYWTSWYLSIPFQFLPVNRISTQLIILEVRENKLCTLSCGEHGQLLITIAAYNRFKVELKQSFMQQFQLKLKKHKDIIITPSILLILGLTRLISSFTLGCMESPRQYWLYLIGYFAAFVSSILTLFVFVLPSKIYRSELNKTVQQWT